MFKAIIKHRLEKYTKKYFKKHPDVKLVAVVGAAGKTTTKTAIADVLSQKYNVQMEPENYNEQIAVPLGILGVKYPEPKYLKSLATWHNVFKACKYQIKTSQAQVIVQELGTDHPGEIPYFGRYLHPDITVVTSIVPEHMEFFKTIEAVAEEEFALVPVSKKTIVNIDDTPAELLEKVDPTNVELYGFNTKADYRFGSQINNPIDGYDGKIVSPSGEIDAKIGLVGEHNLHAGLAAAAVGLNLGMEPQEVVAGLATVQPVHGRMNILQGLHGAVIIDDTYNSSPQAAVAALKTLYEIPAERRIAVLGNMNELGDYAQTAHEAVGEFLDGEYLSWVITMGELANKYIAPLAGKAGVSVQETTSPIEAGAFANKLIDPEQKTVILFKGSQNGVLLEEGVKIVVDEDEYDQLVRQSEDWMEKKEYLYEKEFPDAESDD